LKFIGVTSIPSTPFGSSAQEKPIGWAIGYQDVQLR